MGRALLFLLLAMTARAEQARFYVGTFTSEGASEGLYTGVLDTATGALGPVTLAGKAINPSFAAVSPDGKFLYAVQGEGRESLGAYAVGPGGGLTFLNEQPSGGAGACHVWVDSKQKHALIANYGGGSIACFPIGPDGSLGKRTAFVQFSGSGPHPTRQAKSYAHAVYTDPESRFVYACDLGADKVWSFRFDETTGSLTPTDPPAGMTPPGGGPRHLALHPNGRFAYANNEMGLSVTAFERNPESGVLAALQTVPTSQKLTGPVEGITTAEIACHPSGKWLYVSSRGDDIIAVYAIGGDGRLSLLENVPAGVAVPRGMALDPTGRWLVVAGQKSGDLVVLKIDPQTGKLSPTGGTAKVPSPVCVAFVPGQID